MGRAEVGTPKYVANQIKSKGLQRLRWYCQICEKQCRDENGFKCHTASESHVRKALEVGQNRNKTIDEYSSQFKRDFVTLLRTSHGEKKIGANRFYQEYIQDKNHIHMNATRWPSLAGFVKTLGQDGVVRVDESEQEGLVISWIDNSPEALARQEVIKSRDRREKGDEAIEHKILERQIKLAGGAVRNKVEIPLEASKLTRSEGSEPIKLGLSFKKTGSKVEPNTRRAIGRNVFKDQGSGPKLGALRDAKITKEGPKTKINAFQRIMLREQAGSRGSDQH